MGERLNGLGHFRDSFLPRSVKQVAGRGILALGLLLAGCEAQSPKPPSPTPSSRVTTGSIRPQEESTPILQVDTSLLGLELPFKGIGYLTGGPHSDGLSGSVRYALDFAPREVVPCPGGSPVKDWEVVATASGKVAVVGNEKDRNDPNHSVVEIDHGAFSSDYFHLADIQVNVGQNVEAGQFLGYAACEAPKGGETKGVHAHFGVKVGGKYVPITNTVISGYRVIADEGNYQGRMEKNGRVVVADVGRQGNELESPFPYLPRTGGSEPQVLGIPATPTRVPTKVPTAVLATPTPMMEDKAMMEALKGWLNPFINFQDQSSRGITLSMKTSQINGKPGAPATVEEFINRLLSNPNNTFFTNWVETHRYSSFSGIRVIYSFGQADIQKVHMQHLAKDTLSNADMANDYQYRGRERIEYTYRWQGWTKRFPDGSPSPQVSFQGQPYSQWKDASLDMTVVMKNGKWSVTWPESLYNRVVYEPLDQMSEFALGLMVSGLSCPDTGCRAPQNLSRP